MVGSRIAHYEVIEEIGKGGMGEVYLAQDTKLDRHVAIKVLPGEFLADATRRARFEREAKVLAALNHPQVAAIYGFEEAGDKCCLILELAPGETLTERIARGPLSLAETIGIATQIASALEAAHDQGIVHRDLKPDNIKIDDHDQIKVLDFGLAKAEIGDPTISGSEPILTQSPTMTKGMTTAGSLMGTAAYMSPEQARGKPVDSRSDLWALGCVIYEMLAGRPLFGGETVTDILAAVVTKDPDFSDLPKMPAALQRLMDRCLTKDARDRMRHAGDARLELLEAREQLCKPTVSSDQPSGGTAWSKVAAIAALTLIGGLAIGYFASRPSTPVKQPPIRMTVDLEHPFDRSGIPQRLVDISSNGRRIAFAGNTGGRSRIFLRDLSNLEIVELADSDSGTSPFFSPDGESIGYATRSHWVVQRLDGPEPEIVAPIIGLPSGAHWGDDGTIVFCTNGYPTPMLARPGASEPTSLEIPGLEANTSLFAWPQFLPGSREIVVTYRGELEGKEGPHVVIISRDTGAMHLLTQGEDPRYIKPGYLLYSVNDTTMAAKYEAGATELAGTPFTLPMLDGAINNFGMGIAVADNGTLVSVTSGSNVESQLVWVNREGEITPASQQLAAYASPRISPDGKRAISWIRPGGYPRLLVNDFERDALSNLNLKEFAAYPIWSLDGEEIFVLTSTAGVFGIYSASVDSTEEAELRIEGPLAGVPLSFTPDGKTMLLYYVDPDSKRDIWTWEVGGDAKPLIQTPHNERGAMLSPDGKWFVYVSDEDRQDEIYIKQLPDTGKRWRVSIDGGSEPIWSPQGDEVFFRKADQMLAVPVQTGESLQIGRPQELFSGFFIQDGFGNANYDVTADAQRFLMIVPTDEDAADSKVEIVFSWFQLLEELAAGG